MPLISLSAVQARFSPHTPLPWTVFNEHGQVLWARGHLPSAAERVSLCLSRGLFADEQELMSACEHTCRQGAFFECWAAWELRLALLLRQPLRSGFVAGVRAAAAALVALVEADADKALFAVLRHDHSRFAAYGVAHALHVAAIGVLLARQQGWAQEERTRLAGAALTMNLSILELQGTLAASGGRLTAAQQVQVHCHPDASAALLVEAGLDDILWLDAVRNHHETPEGRGYPRGFAACDTLSRLLHLADVFTAKHAARIDRQPLSPAEAHRALAASDDELARALAALLGPYPPGCFVRLTSGEVALVLRRQAGAGTLASPTLQVAVLQEGTGVRLVPPAMAEALATPQGDALAVAHTLDEAEVLVRIAPDALYALAGAPMRDGHVPEDTRTWPPSLDVLYDYYFPQP